jgi:SAM-dependent methyltransferase
MDEYTQANRAVWNAWTLHHLASDHHQDAARVRAGGSSLRPIELAEMGDVAGKSLLHLQCNMGSDTLSWARLGARVTGVDFAEAAIEQARTLARETGLDARFIVADLYALPDTLDERFDIVFTSYGALCWLPDLPRWARIAAHYVRPGGTFCMVEMHPLGMLFDAQRSDVAAQRFQGGGSYFHAQRPAAEPVIHTGESGPETVYAWRYSLGEVLTALADAGLHLRAVRELPMAHYQQFPGMTEGDDRYWHWPHTQDSLPLLFSVRATKPA